MTHFMIGTLNKFIDGRKLICAPGFCESIVTGCFLETPRPASAHDALKLLISVTFMILGYQRIVPGMRNMVAEGLLREPLAEGTASQQLRRLVPENILGSLSGVRYTFTRAATT